MNASEEREESSQEVKQEAVVVTTEHRGVFFGYVTERAEAPKKITLSEARMCVSWSSSIKGVLGLASSGPDSDCRISQAIPQLEVWKVTGIMSCTEEAAQKWEQAPWS